MAKLKCLIGKSRKFCKRRQLLEDVLWAHRIEYQTLLGMSPYQIVFSNPATYQLKWNIELIGQSSSAIWPTT
ncbi:hypothetical protein CR513_04351, partial [Mucuna pruriens]